MNCEHCGAVLKLSSDGHNLACDYCGAESLIPLTEANTEGVVIIGPASSHNCPTCLIPLQLAVVDDSAAAACERCRGVLLVDRLFKQIVDDRRWAYSGPERKPVPIDRHELDDRVHCPGCDYNMDRHFYNGPGNVVIDSCFNCGYVWLNSGELTQLAEAAGQRSHR